MRFFRPFGLAKPPDSWQALPQGDMIKEKVQERLDIWMPRLLGDSLLKVGSLSQGLDTSRSPVKETLVMNRIRIDGVDLLSKTHEIPVASFSIDVVVSAFTLNFTRKPHTTLRELHRLLVGDGYLILVNFNPWSLWGLSKLLLGITGRVPWNANFYTPARINDWLHLLGFDLIDYQFIAYAPPFSWVNPRKFEFIGRYLPRAGGISIMLVRKNTVQRLPIGPAWQRSGSLAGQFSSFKPIDF